MGIDLNLIKNIMTPKDKAKELVSIFGKKIGKELKNGSFRYNIEITKQCALIAVNEIINMCKLYHNHNVVIDTKIYTELAIDYWQEVKQEIEKF